MAPQCPNQCWSTTSLNVTVSGFTPDTLFGIEGLARGALAVSIVTAGVGIFLDAWFLLPYTSAVAQKFKVVIILHSLDRLHSSSWLFLEACNWHLFFVLFFLHYLADTWLPSLLRLLLHSTVALRHCLGFGLGESCHCHLRPGERSVLLTIPRVSGRESCSWCLEALQYLSIPDTKYFEYVSYCCTVDTNDAWMSDPFLRSYIVLQVRLCLFAQYVTYAF